MQLWSPRHRTALQLACAALVLACGEPVAPRPVPQTIATAAGDGQTGEVGAALVAPVRVTVRDVQGRPMRGETVRWAVTLGGGTVSPDRTVTDSEGVTGATWVLGTAAGLQTLTASAGPVTVTLSAQAVPGATSRVQATPDSASIAAIGDTTRFVARPLDAHGNLTPGTTVSWRSLDEGVVAVDAAGLATARANGVARLVAAAGSAADTVLTTVRQAVAEVAIVPVEASLALGGKAALAATAADARGVAVTDATIRWTSSDPSVIAVDSVGVLAAVGVGRATITAQAGGRAATAEVVVTTTAIETLTASPESLTLSVGENRPLAIEARGANGAVLRGRIVAFSSANAAVARVSPNGVVTAVAPGVTTIVAEAEGKSARVAVRVADAPVDSVAITLNAPAAAAGETVRGTVTAYAADRRVLTGRAITVSSSDEGVARVSEAGGTLTITTVAAGTTTIGAASEGKSASVQFVVTRVPVRTVSVVPDAVRLAAGQWAQLTATPADGSGAPLADRAIAWRSSDTTVATVSASGVVTGRAAGGSATIVAASEGVEGKSAVVVDPAPVAAVAVTPATPTVALNATVALAARLSASDGTVLTGRPIVWSSGAPDVATVSASGVVTAVGVGTAEIVATSEGQRGATVVTVVPGTTVFVARVSPDTIVAGGTATIAGFNFAPSPAANVVTIAGVRATVVAATATQLSVNLPPASAFGCSPVAAAQVQVQGPAGSSSRASFLRTASVHALARGEAVALAGENAPCYELASDGGKYMLAVVNTGAAPGPAISFQLRGALTGAPAPLAAGAAPLGARVSIAPAPAPMSDLAADAHLRALEASRALAERLGRPRAPEPLGGVRGMTPNLSLAAVVPGPVGGLSTVRLPNVDDLCATQATLTMRTVYSGTRAVLLEDVASPSAGRVDDLYRQLGETFDRSQYDMIARNFADPLTFDGAPSMSHVGKVVMVFTPRVAQFGLIGFVSSGDFYSPSQCGASNQAATVYAVTPSLTDAASWARRMQGTLAHEVKHIASFAERMARPGPYEASWLEEATAQVASELFAREAHGYSQYGNADYAAAVQCEVAPQLPQCAGKPEAISHPMSWLAAYMRSVETSSPIDDSDNVKYGGGWYLVRWALDHGADSESQMLRAMTTDKQRTGVANLVARLGGRPFADVATGFALALAGDDFPGMGAAGSADANEPSWNLRDVQLGLYGSYQLRTRTLPHGAFTADVPGVRGGSAAYFSIAVPNGGAGAGRQVVGLGPRAAATGGPELRLAIIRVE